MKRFSSRLCAATLLLCLLCFGAAAHPGRTDSRGGHMDHSTGQYHYHHGKPAHQHPGGVCPYSSSSSKSSSASSSSSGGTKNSGSGIGDTVAKVAIGSVGTLFVTSRFKRK